MESANPDGKAGAVTTPGVLVLCTGNSARSQMAEALLRRRLDVRTPVYSAGTEPAERVHPLAVRVLREAGLDVSGLRPKHFRDYLGRLPVHTVIIVCDGANKSCPTVWPGAYERLFWPFEDPAAFAGSDDERLAKFREIRDAIAARIDAWLEERGEA
jgi:arsenate reductase